MLESQEALKGHLKWATSENEIRTEVSIAARGAEQEGRSPSQGSRGFGAGASEFDPSFQKFGVSETPSQRPLRGKALRASGGALQGPRRGVSVFKGVGKEGGLLRGP